MKAQVYLQSTSYTKLLHSHDDISCIARFRLRSHNLHVEAMRSVPRSSRICDRCAKISSNLRVVEDELHFILECPLYNSERAALFSHIELNLLNMDKEELMLHIMNPTSFAGWRHLIKYINACEVKRSTHS